MVKIRILSFAILILFVFGCTKKEEKQIELKGNLSLKISPVSELGALVKEKAGIEVTIEGTTPEVKATTDTSGCCLIKNLPMGTYNLRVSKEGYGTIRYQGFRYIGADSTIAYETTLIQKSTTKILSYNLSISGSTLTVNGTISHNYPISESIYPSCWPSLVIYLSNKPEVSSLSYLSLSSFYSNPTDNTTFSTNINLNFSPFPQGSTVYVALYGKNRFDYSTCYDPEKGIYYSPNLGEASEVKSIVVP